MVSMKSHTDINELFHNKTFIKVAAPMVRYSKLQFRTLVRKYGCDLCFSPMIVADSFISSLKARENEFTTNNGDTPLCIQFAANNSNDFVTAAKLVAPYVDGVDLNCGCPQRWAMKEGFGCDLLKKPQIIRDSVLQLRNAVPKPFAVSVKIRLLSDIKQTVELCRSLEACGVTFISVHLRTPAERCEPIHLDALSDIKKSVTVPIVANGDVKTLQDAEDIHRLTGCDGVMAARGLLQNPALFSGHTTTPLSCVQDWIDLAIDSEMPFQCFHHHLVFMLEKVLPKSERVVFNVLNKKTDVLNFLSNRFKLNIPAHSNVTKFIFDVVYNDADVYSNEGSYFRSKINTTTCESPFEDFLSGSSIFDE